MKTLILLLFVTFAGYAQVGIGITSPTATLDIDGNLRVRGLTDSPEVDFLVTDDDGFVFTRRLPNIPPPIDTQIEEFLRDKLTIRITNQTTNYLVELLMGTEVLSSDVIPIN